jgi:hypothetical protein
MDWPGRRPRHPPFAIPAGGALTVAARGSTHQVSEGLRQLDDGLWVAEAPLRSWRGDIGRRMSVVAVGAGGVWVHSPVPLTAALRGQLDGLGGVSHVVAPSRFHGHLFMEQYQAAYPEASVGGPPGLARKRRDLRFTVELGDRPAGPWADELDQARIWGHPWNEIVFLHRGSRTLIVGDCLFALGPGSSRGLWLWTGALRRPSSPELAARQLVPWRLTVRDRNAIRRSLEHILTWDFDRVVVGHGEIVTWGGRQALRDAYGLTVRC